MNILITGSAGFIGGHLVRRLLEQGHHVTGVDNYIGGQPATTERLRHPRFQFTEADVRVALPYSGPRLDWVLHLASLASPAHYQRFPLETLQVNAQGTQQALELAAQHGATFLLASSSEVYGDPLAHPQREDDRGHVSCTGPRSCYDEAKRYAEALTMAYHRTRGAETRIVRIFNTYGPHMRPDDGRVVTTFVQQALRGEPLTVYGDGEQTRSFQYVDDLIDGLLRLMAVPYHGPVNLGNPEEVTVLELARLVGDLVGSPPQLEYRPLPPDDPRRRQPDITLARRLLDWVPRIGLREGLERLLAEERASGGGRHAAS
ncbi:SDR family oxidoreductase [Deinococcus sp. SDU3-2]|uniref:SDR family oxidoreductase n=1 Tax=Deinococcus terrestris TaxID=2651870 RepID=A0A7X1TSN4_9DEIO|nr:UDP-glucuronic acid decarboxylase family protein [Deinococcus terrestris]MPY67629.1 SDR family oxidoreductase [Deinococcus terrestris]